MRRAIAAALFPVLFVAACAAFHHGESTVRSGAPANDADRIVAARDRSEADRALDAGRKPAELLRFLDLRPGMRVADLMSGGGYTAELLARAVGPTGVVYSQNNAFVTQRFAEKPWSERLATPAMKNVVRVDRELENPLPPEAKNLDAVVMVLFYHDTVWQNVDRDAMNRAIFDALRPGGEYVIVDHSGRAGTGTSETKTLHRIEEKVVREEVARAGFQLAGEAGFLGNPNDPRDWNDSPMAAGARRGTSDRFVLKFVRP
jgi:predicted methyltransferase